MLDQLVYINFSRSGRYVTGLNSKVTSCHFGTDGPSIRFRQCYAVLLELTTKIQRAVILHHCVNGFHQRTLSRESTICTELVQSFWPDASLGYSLRIELIPANWFDEKVNT